MFGGYIYLYMQSEDDELFDKMTDQISNAIYKPIAIEHVIDEHYDTIVEYINDKHHGFGMQLEKKVRNGNVNGLVGINATVQTVKV